MNKPLGWVLASLLFCGLASGQVGPAPGAGARPGFARPMARRGMMPRGAPLGKWWKNSALVKELGVSDAQVEQIERIFQDHRLKLIDLRAALEKNEALLEPLIEVDHPDEAKVVAQIDKVAQSRAELEKSNAQMLLAIRRVLTVDQWKKLQEHSRRMERFPRPGQPQPQGPPPRPGA